MKKLLTLSLFSFILSGCTHLMISVTEDKIDQQRGKRTLGSIVEDSAIELKTRVNIYKASPDFNAGHIVVVSYNGYSLLTGQVQSEELKNIATRAAEDIRHVREVFNEMEVAGPISRLTRFSDAWLTTKIKTRLLLTSQVPGKRSKIVTENGAVYVMGLLTKSETEAVINSIQKTYGVQRIIKIIEYID